MGDWREILEAAKDTVRASVLRPILQTAHRAKIVENIRQQKVDLDGWFSRIYESRKLLREIREATEEENEIGRAHV